MRAATAFVLFGLLLPATAVADQAPKLKSAEGDIVFVIDEQRREWVGRLLKVSADSLILEDNDGSHEFALAKIRRVDAENDSIRDGAIKGVIFGGVLGLLYAAAYDDARPLFTSVLVYGAIGAGIDALNRNKHTVYSGPARLAVTIKW